MTDLTKAKLKICGRVQGVFYRQATCQKATALGLWGWVKNMDDGTVEAEVAGPTQHIDELIAWCWQGPPASHVKDFQVTWQDQALDISMSAPRFKIL